MTRSGDPLLSVVVCTRDRPQALRRMLESACALEVSAGVGWELIVVDNGSGEAASAVAAEFAQRLPVRAVREPVPGLGNARNRGVEEALGRYVCWTDDDVIVSPGWLAAYCEAFDRHPEAALFGGKVIPCCEPSADSAWFEPRMKRWPLAGPVAYRDFGDSVLPLEPRVDRLPWGANFAVRAREQKGARFDPAVGPLGDETDLICRLLRAGASGWWVPESEVTHMIPPERQSRDYLLAYYRSAGAAAAYFQCRDPRHNPMAPETGPAWIGRGSSQLALPAAASRAISAGAWALGLRDISLRFLARQGYLEGLIRHRRSADEAPLRVAAA